MILRVKPTSKHSMLLESSKSLVTKMYRRLELRLVVTIKPSLLLLLYG